jgi:hypothetical protein
LFKNVKQVKGLNGLNCFDYYASKIVFGEFIEPQMEAKNFK